MRGIHEQTAVDPRSGGVRIVVTLPSRKSAMSPVEAGAKAEDGV